MKKKVLVSLMCAGAVLSLVSCRTITTTPTPTPTPTPVLPTPTPTPEPTTPEVVKFTISFNTMGGDALEAIEVDGYKTVASLPTPTKTGYAFVAWYRDEALTDSFELNRTFVDRNVTLYAKWETARYVVKEFYSTGEEIIPYKVNHGVKLGTPVKAGYKFVGFFLDDKYTIPYENTGVTGDLTVYLKLELLPTYDVTYVINGHGEQPEALTDVYKLPSELPLLKEEGYKFLGWYTDEELTVEAEADMDVTADVTLYAKWELITYTVTYQNNGFGVKPEDLKVAELPNELPVLSADDYEFLGWFYDSEFTDPANANDKLTENVTLYAKWIQHKQVTFVINGIGEQPDPMVIGTFTNLPKLYDASKAKVFIGWYTDAALTTPVDKGAYVLTETTLYALWKDAEEVTYILDDNEFVAEVIKEDLVINTYTIVAGSEMRNRTKSWTNPEDSTEKFDFIKSIKMGSDASKLVIDVKGDGKLSIWVQNGSSSATTQFVKFGIVGEELKKYEFAGTNASSPIVKLEFDVEGGNQYVICRNSGTVDLYRAEMTCLIQKSEICGFDIYKEGVVDYLIGDTLDTSKLVVNAVYGSGRTEVIDIASEDLVIDSSKVDFTKAGVYQVSVKYKDYEAQEYEVAVYSVTDIELGFNTASKKGSSVAGNGVYYNDTVQRIYVKDAESLDPSYLTVKAIATHPTDNTKTLETVISASEYVLSGFDSATAGKKEITVTYAPNNAVTAKFDVWVVDTLPSFVNDVVQVKVEKNYDGVVGAVVEGYNMFTTIQQALDYLALSDIPSSTKKVLVIGEGLFNEKLEVTIPNLTIKGAGAEKTTIEWDSLYGLQDEGGFTHTTDSTQTVAIRDAAVNCIIEDITISNYWNSLERFDDKLGENYAEHRALALLVQSDRFIMRNSKLLGYQDTLELFYGRQLFEKVYISGTTDYIFGTNNTTYFKECTIHTIDSHANRGTKSDGGYITAFKGNNKDANDAVQYGAIFDGCKFTGSDDILADKNTAIARTWGAYAAVMIMNSELGAHISTKENKSEVKDAEGNVTGYVGSATKNVRYVSMNSVDIVNSETIKFFEYNNTGAGAITESQAGVTVLKDASEAAKFADYSVIFGETNGKVTYTNPWDPNNPEAADDKSYYFFDGQSSDTGMSYTFDTTTTIANGSTVEFGNLIISAENGKVAWNQNAKALNMKANSFIKFNVEAGSKVTIKAYSAQYNCYDLNGIRSTTDTITQYYSEATEVKLLSFGDSYLYSIIINPNEEAPEAAILDSIKAENVTLNYKVGDEVTFDEIIVKAFYSDDTYVLINEGYYIDDSAVKNDEAGSYDVKVTFGGKEEVLTLVFEDPNADPAITTNTTFLFNSEDNYNAMINNPRVEANITASRHNGDNYQLGGTIAFLVKAGTYVTVKPYQDSQYVNYTLGAEGEELTSLNSEYTYIATEDCKVVYTGNNVGSGNYIKAIEIVCPIINQTYAFGSTNTQGDFTNVVASTGNIIISGKTNDNGGSFQIGEGATISFVVPAYATVTVVGHDANYGQFKILVNNLTKDVAIDSNGVYKFDVPTGGSVILEALNVGTEEAPAYNKSYVRTISVTLSKEISEDTKVSFGSEGNYKESGIDFSNITLRDNGGNNSQINNGSFSFIVNKGAVIKIKGFSGYTSYTLSDGTTTTAEINDVDYTYTAEKRVLITITAVNDNNYFYYFTVEYPVEEVYGVVNTIWYFDSNEANKEDNAYAYRESVQGSSLEWKGLTIDATAQNAKLEYNASGYAQFNANTKISFEVAANATVKVVSYPGQYKYTINGVAATADETVVQITEAGPVEIVATDGAYIYSISVEYLS